MTELSGRLIAAARALTGVSRKDLAERAAVSAARLSRIEASGAALLPSAEVEGLRRALESFGAEFIPEGDGMGAGVRLKFSRLDVKQISRLENEGGPAADDDVP